MKTVIPDDTPLSMAQVAKHFFPNEGRAAVRRVLRSLQRLQEKRDATLLVNTGLGTRPHYTVTMGALRRVVPEWFIARSPEQIAAHGKRSLTMMDRVDELESIVRTQASFIEMLLEFTGLPTMKQCKEEGDKRAAQNPPTRKKVLAKDGKTWVY